MNTRQCFIPALLNNLEARVLQHKHGEGGLFTSKYNCCLLLYYEDYSDIRNAIAREKQLKKWKRQWKMDLIQKDNPALKDIAENWYR